MLPAQIRPNRIELIGEAIRDIRRQHIIRQVPTGEVRDRLLSNQVKMISRHAVRTRHRGGRSASQRDCDFLAG